MSETNARYLRSNRGRVLSFAGLFTPNGTGTVLTGTVDLSVSGNRTALEQAVLNFTVGGKPYSVTFGIPTNTLAGTVDMTGLTYTAGSTNSLDGKTLTFQFGNQPPITVMFSNPSSAANVAAQINAQIPGVASIAGGTNYLTLASGVSAIQTVGGQFGTALAVVGMTAGQQSAVTWASDASVAAIATRINQVCGQTVAAAGGASSHYIVLSGVCMGEGDSNGFNGIVSPRSGTALALLGFTANAKAYQSLTEANTAYAKVARTGVGKITVYFKNYFKEVWEYNAKLHMGTPDGSYAQIDSFTAGSSSANATMVIGTYTSLHAAADIAAATGNTVTWSATVRD